jgi:hypothetical protein
MWENEKPIRTFRVGFFVSAIANAMSIAGEFPQLLHRFLDVLLLHDQRRQESHFAIFHIRRFCSTIWIT